MAAERHFCTSCGRSPVVGERLHVFEDAGRQTTLCDICLSEADLETLGKHVISHRIRASERRLRIVSARAA